MFSSSLSAGMTTDTDGSTKAPLINVQFSHQAHLARPDLIPAHDKGNTLELRALKMRETDAAYNAIRPHAIDCPFLMASPRLAISLHVTLRHGAPTVRKVVHAHASFLGRLMMINTYG
jgi:hypothetical protein